MKIKSAILGLIPALVLAAGSAHATQTVVTLDGTFAPTKFFYSVDTGPGASFSADYGATPKTATTSKGAFDYLFEFTTPVGGIGNGSFSATLGKTSAITGVYFNGVKYDYPTGNASLKIEPFAVAANTLNIIEVVGKLGSAKSVAFDGTATFEAAVPEPASWATFLMGFGFIGMALRRKINAKLQTA